MPRVRNLQSGFTAGMLDPAMAMRSDNQNFYAGASSILNMELMPQGGGRVRDGFAFVQALDDVTADGVEGVRLFELRFSREATYLIVLTHLHLRVFKDGLLVGDLGADDGIPWTGAQVNSVTCTRSAETLLLFHPAVRPQRLLRHGADDAWSFGPMPIDCFPTKSFSSVSGSLTLGNNTGENVTYSSDQPDFAEA